MIRVIVKKPGQAWKHVGISGDLQSMQEIVGGLIQAVPGHSLGLPEGVDLYVNEEGKMIGLMPNLALWDGQDQAWGTVFFCAVDYDTGDNRSLRSDEQAAVAEFCERNALALDS